MDISLWIDRLYEDESLGGDLEQEEAKRLFSWAELRLESCDSDEDAKTVIDAVRRVGRLVDHGASFERLLAVLDKSASSHTPHRASRDSTASPRSSEDNDAVDREPSSKSL